MSHILNSFVGKSHVILGKCQFSDGNFPHLKCILVKWEKFNVTIFKV